MKLSNKWYDALKWIALVCFPAVETLWYTLAKIWNLPYAGEITATIAAVGLFIGALIGVSTIQYNKGLKDDKE